MRIAHFLLGGLLATAAGAAHAAAFLDFSGLRDAEQPGAFYAGGAGSLGSVGGPERDFGVTFTNAAARCNVSLDCGAAHQDILLFSTSAGESLAPADFHIDVAGGFKDDLSFVFASPQAGTAELWSGLGGTGVKLGVLELGAGSCPEPGLHCAFREVVARLGDGQIAHSIRFTGVDPDFFAIDNLGLSLAGDPISAAPEPAVWWLMLAGFGLVGAGLRRSRALAG